MQYLGNKNRISKHILPFLLENRKEGQYYVEPFVGGANMIAKVSGLRIGADTHTPLIELLKKLQDSWIPPTIITKEDYYNIKKDLESPNYLKGFVGFLCSFGGKWWGGYAKNNKGDNYADRGSRCLVKQSKNLKGIEFYNCSYNELLIPPNSIIYCDPPYEGTTGYKDGLSHLDFWQWCREKANQGHTIFVSEYKAPDDFDCLLEIKHKTILDKNSQKERVEKLFTFFAKN